MLCGASGRCGVVGDGFDTRRSFLAALNQRDLPASGVVRLPLAVTITTDVYDEAGRQDWEPHTHDDHMLVWPERGSVEADVDGRAWLVPPGLGLWVPAGTLHAVRTKPGVRFNCSYFEPDAATGIAGGVTMLAIDPAAMALLAHVETGALSVGARARAQQVILDLLAGSAIRGLVIRMPKDPRIEALVEYVFAHPEDSRSVEDWAHSLNVSVRTLSRIFVSGTGTSFARWRTLVRMREAMSLLDDGLAVGAVSQAVGYSAVSAFSAAFRRETGFAPGMYQNGHAVTEMRHKLTA